jgi:two-component system phosphate regulon sensor histidine kinase PhoR
MQLLSGTQALQILDALSDAIVITDDALNIQYLNEPAEQLTGLESNPQQTNLETIQASLNLDVQTMPIKTKGLRIFKLQPAQSGNNSDNHQQLPESTTKSATPAQRYSALLQTFDNQPDRILLLFDNLSTGLIALNQDQQIQFINKTAEHLFGRTETQVHGQDVNWLVPELDQKLLVDLSPDNTTRNLTLHHHDRVLVSSIIPLNAPKNDIHALLTFFDITPYQMRTVERTGLLRMIIHDIANPLNIALNFANLMRYGILEEGEYKEATVIIADHLHRMQVLLQDLMLLEQMSEDIKQSFTLVDVDLLVASVVSTLESRAAERNIHLRLNPLPPEACIAYGNERLLQQAVYNLIENAIKYTMKEGWVRITVRIQHDWIEILVADNGIGIPPEKRARLFAPFYRVDDPRMSSVQGSGLGLSLIRMVAEQHEGQIWLHSVPEQGSIFVMRIRQSRQDSTTE